MPLTAPAPEETSTGPLHGPTRWAVGGLLVLAVLNAGFLYGTPGRADTGYAWSIKPPASAAFLGAGYLAGIVATALVVFVAGHWRSAQPLAVALVTLSVGLLAATLLHTDRFRWDYPPTWALDRGVRARAVRRLRAGPPPARDHAAAGAARCAPERAAGGVRGCRSRAARLRRGPVRVPDAAGRRLAVAADAAARPGGRGVDRDDRRRAAVVRPTTCAAAAEAVIPYATLGAWCLALLALPALHAGDLTRNGTPLDLYIAALVVLLALAALGVTRGSPAERRRFL